MKAYPHSKPASESSVTREQHQSDELDIDVLWEIEPEPVSERLARMKQQIVARAVVPIWQSFFEKQGQLRLQHARAELSQRRRQAKFTLRMSTALGALCSLLAVTGMALAKQSSSKQPLPTALQSAASLRLDVAPGDDYAWLSSSMRALGDDLTSASGVKEARPALSKAVSAAAASKSTRSTPKPTAKASVQTASKPTTTRAAEPAPFACDPNDVASFDPLNGCLP